MPRSGSRWPSGHAATSQHRRHRIEGEEGASRWRLVELEGDGWDVLHPQSNSMTSSKAAMAAGLLELQKRVEDLDIGPKKG